LNHSSSKAEGTKHVRSWQQPVIYWWSVHRGDTARHQRYELQLLFLDEAIFILGIILGIERLERASAPAAVHNSGERFDPPKCHPNTRVAVIELVMRWILGQENSEALIMWLFGPAGSGKSAIGQTLAERCYESGILLASFFFSRSDPTRNHFRSLFATIAYQVVVNFPDSRDIITNIPEQDPLVLTQSFDIQLNSLIIGPLQQLYLAGRPPSSSDPYLILIDGLDECADPQVQAGILKSISKAVKQCQFPLKFLIVSRPEPHLTMEFNSRTINPILTRLALDDKFLPDDDIRRFLQDKCAEIRRTHPLKRFLSPSWPSAEIIERLVEKSSGQFIYVSTIVKFITSPRRHPYYSLNEILVPRPSSEHNSPFSELDTLYTHILSSVADLDKTLRILGFLVVCQNLHMTTPVCLEDFLMLRPGEAELFAGELASVATIKKQAGKEFVSLIHASLGDFLLEQSRSKQFALSPNIIHAYLAHLCFQSIKRYQIRGESGEWRTTLSSS